MLYSRILSMIVWSSAALLAYPSLTEAGDGDPRLGCGETIRAAEGWTVVVPVILHLGSSLALEDHVVKVYKPGLPNKPWITCMWKNNDDLHAPDICNEGSTLSRILDHMYGLMIPIPTIRKEDSGNYNISWTISSSQDEITKHCISKLLVEEGKSSPTTRQGPTSLGDRWILANGVRHLGCGEAIRVPEGSTVLVPVILHLGNTPAPEEHVVRVNKPGQLNNEHPWITCMWTNEDKLHAHYICNEGSRLSRILTHIYRLMIRIPTIRKEDSGNYVVSWMVYPDPDKITRTCVVKLLVEEEKSSPTTRQGPVLLETPLESGAKEAESREVSNVATGVISSTLTVVIVLVIIAVGWFLRKRRQRRLAL